MGIWIINPYHQRGEISYDEAKTAYKQKGGAGFIGKYFGQESLPNVSRDAQNLKNDLYTFVEDKGFPFDIEPKVVNLFFAEEVEIIGNNFPDICLRADKLKNHIRKNAKQRILSPQNIEVILSKFPEIE